jgi:hypothetical protein
MRSYINLQGNGSGAVLIEVFLVIVSGVGVTQLPGGGGAFGASGGFHGCGSMPSPGSVKRQDAGPVA